ncbi:MAG: S8 family serine peptidase, partial [Candidatus Aminicenantales bacterium]
MKEKTAFRRVGTGVILFAAAVIGLRSLSVGIGDGSDDVAFYRGAACGRDKILVKFRPEIGRIEAGRILSAFGAQEDEIIPGIGIHQLQIRTGTCLADKIAEISRDPRVVYAEPDYCLHLASTVPADPFFSYQWALRNTGQLLAPPPIQIPSGTPGADMKASEVWDIFRGSSTTLVGVVDTGVDLTHPDLINHIDSPGIDFANNDYEARDDHGHGTHVAGIIGAEADNGQGVAGVNWSVRILPVKVFNRNAVGQTSWVANGIIWATQHGARVINMSLGGRDVIANQTLEIAIKYAFDRNVVLVAAAGNDGKEGVWFPAAYGPYVIAAAATDQFDLQVTRESSGGSFGS